MSFICTRMKNRFHISSFTIGLALKQRLGATRKLTVEQFANSCHKQLLQLIMPAILRKPISLNFLKEQFRCLVDNNLTVCFYVQTLFIVYNCYCTVVGHRPFLTNYRRRFFFHEKKNRKRKDLRKLSDCPWTKFKWAYKGV